jgi:Fur family ferric uptake transcriptional regulator
MPGRTSHAEEDARFRLRRAGLRVTGTRLRVIRALQSGDTPLNAQEIVGRLGDEVDRVTVYRTLNTLVDRGIAHRVNPGDRVFRFGLSPGVGAGAGGSAHGHPHFVCDECGAVECLEDAEVIVKPRAAARTRGKSAAARRTPAFRVSQQEVLLHGTCGDCTTPSAGSSRKPARARRPGSSA